MSQRTQQRLSARAHSKEERQIGCRAEQLLEDPKRLAAAAAAAVAAAVVDFAASAVHFAAAADAAAAAAADLHLHRPNPGSSSSHTRKLRPLQQPRRKTTEGI